MDNFKMLLTDLLNKKGIKTDGIEFVVNSAVNGPAYQNDYIINRKLYEKYQYVKANIK